MDQSLIFFQYAPGRFAGSQIPVMCPFCGCFEPFWHPVHPGIPCISVLEEGCGVKGFIPSRSIGRRFYHQSSIINWPTFGIYVFVNRSNPNFRGKVSLHRGITPRSLGPSFPRCWCAAPPAPQRHLQMAKILSLLCTQLPHSCTHPPSDQLVDDSRNCATY